MSQETAQIISIIARGGTMNGYDLMKQLGVFENSNFFVKDSRNGYIITGSKLADQLEDYLNHLSKVDGVNFWVGLGTLVAGKTVSSQTFERFVEKYLGTTKGQGIGKTVGELSFHFGIMSVISATISSDLNSQIAQTQLAYMRSDSYKGVFVLERRAGLLFLPGSEYYIKEYYDVATGKFLGAYNPSLVTRFFTNTK